MKANVTIRAWERRDRERVQALLKVLSGSVAVTSDDAPTFVAESDGEVVGMVTLCFFTTLTGLKSFVDHLVVDPAWRRRGIGRALTLHAIEEALAAGASRIDLTANSEKTAARALYESLGFQLRDTGTFRLPLPDRSPPH
jgi:ribosomal protein S18 acetylase RimI-like enzyme